MYYKNVYHQPWCYHIASKYGFNCIDFDFFVFVVIAYQKKFLKPQIQLENYIPGLDVLAAGSPQRQSVSARPKGGVD